jgi:hypothetical protein
MRRQIIAGVAVGIPLIAIVIIVVINLFDYKGYIFDYVLNNQPALEDYVDEFATPGLDNEGTYNGWQVNYNKFSKKTKFQVYYVGLLVTSGREGGFYYSPEDQPLSNDVGNKQYTEQADGSFVFDGNNWETTERITEHWFWYEVRF